MSSLVFLFSPLVIYKIKTIKVAQQSSPKPTSMQSGGQYWTLPDCNHHEAVQRWCLLHFWSKWCLHRKGKKCFTSKGFLKNGQLLRWCTFIGLSIFKSQPFPVSAGTLVGRRVGHIQPSDWSLNRTMMCGNIASALPKPYLYWPSCMCYITN